MISTTGYLREDGSPNLPNLLNAFTRCGATIPGGTQWLDNVRYNRWAGQSADGKKHDRDGDPKGAALPWDGASDARPGSVDDIINELKAMLAAAFWQSMVQQGGSLKEGATYAVALVEHLVFTVMLDHLSDEVDLSADYMQHYGWCILAPRWKRELGIRKYKLTWETVLQAAVSAGQQLQQAAQAPQGPQPDEITQRMATLPALLADPTMEKEAAETLRQWYDWYMGQQIPPDLLDKVPKVSVATALKAVRSLRLDKQASVPMPYLCKNEPVVTALKPYDEVLIPTELTDANQILFQVERLSEAELKGRVLGEEYSQAWVDAAVKFKGQWSATQLPTGTPGGVSGNLTGAVSVAGGSAPGDVGNGAIEVIHAIYKEADEDGIPAVYCTTFHRNVLVDANRKDLVAKHEPVSDVEGDMPYVPCLRERCNRAIVSSRGVPERAHTDQNIIKGVLDGVIDRQGITIIPPVNVYDTPATPYRFAPAARNLVRKDKEPDFMQMPSGQGMADAVEVYQMIQTKLDNRFALASPEVPQTRQQIFQQHAVRRFLLAWTRALKQVLCLYQQYGDDAEFAEITGAPVGWLEGKRQQPGLLSCALECDARELDSELMLKRIEAMNKIVLPNDVLNIINRAEWSAMMARGILGPAAAKRLVQSKEAASQALRDKAELAVLKMFAGNAPQYVDDKDPTAAGLLKFTTEIVMANPVYLRALDDEALQALAGEQVQLVLQKIGKDRNPDERFSALLMKWLENLKFIGVTQQQNKQIGRIGVNPEGTE